MLKKLKNKIEEKRNSKNPIWSLAVIIKDSISKVIAFIEKQRAEKKIEEILKKNNCEEIFTSIYKQKIWGKGKFLSGIGSLLQNTLKYRQYVSGFIKKNKIRSVVDLGCGDFQVEKGINRNNAIYTGIDIVEALIKRNNKLYSNNKVKFIKKDIIEEDLPKADLCLIKEVFQHFPYDAILRVIPKLKKYKYILITDCFETDNQNYNLDIKLGDCRREKLKLGKPPFNLKTKTVLEYPKSKGEGTFRTVLIEQKDIIRYNKTKRNLLVTLADKNRVEQAKQLFSSVYFNAGWKGDYMLLAHEIPEKELKWFRKKGILIKKCKPFYVKEIEGWPITILSKFYLFTPEFKKWKNIIFLDTDIIVRASLDSLTNMEGFTAVRDFDRKIKNSFINIKKNKFLFNELKKNYNLKEKAFNSGVMVLNTDIIKEDSFSKLKNFLEKYEKIIKLDDQSILNLFFYKKWTELDLVYNFKYYFIPFSFLNKEKDLEVKAIIIHFAGDMKPWNPNCPFYKEWKHNLEKGALINLKNIIRANKRLTEKEIEKYSKMLKRKNFFSKPLRDANRYISLFRIFLKQNFPKLHYFLKKLKR